MSTCQREGYDFLFTRPTAIGTPDERVLIPLLIHARKEGWETAYITKLLDALGLREIEYHPGYRLRVQLLGDFQAWRGSQAIPSKGWQRTNTRQLFQLFLTYREIPLTRDQIMEHLWPTEPPASSQRKLKVALNTLYRVLEPARAPGAESAYIKRDGLCYQLRAEADIWLDTQVLREKLQRAENNMEMGINPVPLLEETVALYKGEYLPEARYETWAAAEREHLAVLFLRAADHLCEWYLREGRMEAVIDLGRRILAQDNCWERAYRYMMTAYHRLGDHGQVARTYNRCGETLRKELDVSPSPETDALYRQLIG